MLGSNPSADSVASTDRGGCYGIPFQLMLVSPHRDRHQSAKSWGYGGKAPAVGHSPTLCFPHPAGTLSFSMVRSETERRQPTSCFRLLQRAPSYNALISLNRGEGPSGIRDLPLPQLLPKPETRFQISDAFQNRLVFSSPTFSEISSSLG